MLEERIKSLIVLEEEVISDSEKEIEKLEKRVVERIKEIKSRNLKSIEEIIRIDTIEGQYKSQIEYYEGRKINAEIVLRRLKEAIEEE